MHRDQAAFKAAEALNARCHCVNVELPALADLLGEAVPATAAVRSEDGAPLWQEARLWRGQITNFRSEGGGFAPVLLLP